MFTNKKKFIAYMIILTVFIITFSIGVFGNPNFNLRDFCASLAAEFLGMVFALTVVEIYISEKRKDEKEEKDKQEDNIK